MRLINADALNKELQKRVGSPTDEKLYEVNLCIIDAPTIDAIPVEWLKQQRECNDPESVKDINGAFVSICIDGVLMLWQKEQEED